MALTLPSPAPAQATPNDLPERCVTHGGAGTPYSTGINCRVVEVDGHPRRFIVYVPDRPPVTGPRTPVVFMFHGSTATGQKFLRISGWREQADATDDLVGGTSDDVLRGGYNDDDLLGGVGDDWLYGDNGPDSVFGQPGDDHVYGNVGRDDVRGHQGNDDVSGGRGNDLSLTGGDNDDTVDGGAGNDPVCHGGEIPGAEDIDGIPDVDTVSRCELRLR